VFEYNNPTPNFDRSKVLGVATKLITLDKAHDDKAAALEVAAGGKLFHVLVADEGVGKDLIKNGGLRKRVTMAPLNRMNAFKLTPQASPISLVFFVLY
jgi:structural maintenance of chromosome 2